MNQPIFESYTITGNTRETKYLEIAWIDTSEDDAYSDFINETIFDIADGMFGQSKADKIVNDLKASDSFEKAFALLQSWGFGISVSRGNYER